MSQTALDLTATDALFMATHHIEKMTKHKARGEWAEALLHNQAAIKELELHGGQLAARIEEPAE